MQRDLHATVGLAQWIIEAYALFLASLVLVGGALGDRLGRRRRVFSAGVILFTIASAACGCAPDAASSSRRARSKRIVGGALLVPGSLSLISAAYPESERGKAIGIWSMSTAITGAIGPVAGGVAVAQASWRWVFFFNVPVALGILVLAHTGVGDTRDESAPARMDWLGAAIVTAGLGAIVYALIDDGGDSRRAGRGEVALFVAGAGNARGIRTVRIASDVPHGPPLALSLADLRGDQSTHAPSLRRARELALLSSLQSHPSPQATDRLRRARRSCRSFSGSRRSAP